MSRSTEPFRCPLPEPSDTTKRRAATEIVAALRDADHVAYLAGGCVRDELLGREPHDYDIATSARPEEVRRVFPAARSVGESFGVMLVHRRGGIVEVATFREEWGYSDHRRPDGVRFTDAAHDAARRDFTINALFADPVAGEVIDYVGGVADLEAGVVRAVGNPFERLEEDHLRALRAVRFATRLGFDLDERTADAIRRCARHLQGISRERIGHEIRQMLTSPARAAAMGLVQQLKLDAPVLRESNRDVPLDLLAALPDEASYPASLVAWAIDRLGGGDPDRIRLESSRLTASWRRSLMLTNAERDQMQRIMRELVEVERDWFGLRVAQRKRFAASPGAVDVLNLLRVRRLEQWRRVQADIEELRRTGLTPDPLLTGDDLIAMGYEPGPMFKFVLDGVYDGQLEGAIGTVEEARLEADRLASDHAARAGSKSGRRG